MFSIMSSANSDSFTSSFSVGIPFILLIYLPNCSVSDFQYYSFINLFIFGHFGSSLLCEGFLQLQQVGATLHHGAWASHCSGFSCCRARALGAQAQQLWLVGSRAQAQQLWRTGLVAPWHVRSSQLRARTCVPRIGRWILNHCATSEVPNTMLNKW